VFRLTHKIKNLSLLETGIISFILLGFVIYTAFGFIYTSPKHISYDLNAVKYQIGNIEFSEAITFKIDGTFKRKFWGFNDTNQFDGRIIINGKESYSGIVNGTKLNNFKFNEDGMGSIVNDEFEGLIFVDNMMKEVTVKIFEDNGFDFESGWLIAGPAENRNQAIRITNDLIGEVYGRIIQ